MKQNEIQIYFESMRKMKVKPCSRNRIKPNEMGGNLSFNESDLSGGCRRNYNYVEILKQPSSSSRKKVDGI